MNREEAQEVIIRIIAEMAGFSEEDVKLSSTYDELGLNFEDMTELAMTVEDELDIMLDLDKVGNVTDDDMAIEKFVELIFQELGI